MQRLGNAASTTDNPNPVADMPVDEMIDVGAWTTAGAAASPVVVGDEAVTGAPDKVPYGPPSDQGGLGEKMDHDTSAFEVNLADGDSLEDFITTGVNDFYDVFRALDGPDGGGFADGMDPAGQGMDFDDDEFAWLNSPDAFMPLPITGVAGDLGEVAVTATPTGDEEEAGMGPGVGGELVVEGVGGGSPLLAGLAAPEAAAEVAPAADAVVAAMTTLPPVALEEGGTAEVSDSGMSSGGDYTVSLHAPTAHDSGADAGTGGGGGAAYVFAGGAADGAVVVDAVGVGVPAVAVTPTATNITVDFGGGCAGADGGGHDGGLSQKELVRRQKVERYLAKKKRRRWSRASSYQSRQRVANSRPRHKGRFLPLVSEFVPISELKRRQRALFAQQAEEQEGEKQEQSLLPPAASGRDATAQPPDNGGDWTG